MSAGTSSCAWPMKEASLAMSPSFRISTGWTLSRTLIASAFGCTPVHVGRIILVNWAYVCPSSAEVGPGEQG